jgi:hypothetical protein
MKTMNQVGQKTASKTAPLQRQIVLGAASKRRIERFNPRQREALEALFNSVGYSMSEVAS